MCMHIDFLVVVFLNEWVLCIVCANELEMPRPPNILYGSYYNERIGSCSLLSKSV